MSQLEEEGIAHYSEHQGALRVTTTTTTTTTGSSAVAERQRARDKGTCVVLGAGDFWECLSPGTVPWGARFKRAIW